MITLDCVLLGLGSMRLGESTSVASCHIGDALMIGYVSPVRDRDEAKYDAGPTT